MNTINDVHQQFAEYFDIPALRPYAYLLSRKLSEGHICLDLDNMVPAFPDAPAYCYNMVPGSKPLQSIPLVGKKGDERQPFVLYNNRLYLQRYFRYETVFLNRILQFLKDERVVLKERIALLEKHRLFISNLFETKPLSPGGSEDDNADWQFAAAITGILNNITIITGGPGTGKTTTVAKILSVLYTIDPSLKVALAAPTGKAAARLGESLRQAKLPVDNSITEKFQSLNPGTIHRLLKRKKDSPYFHHNAGNPLSEDVIIVDECSMIDVALFAKLLDAVDTRTRVILLGDKDQLASVEAGSLFGDLCQSQDILNLFSSDRVALINSFINDKQRHIPSGHISKDSGHPLFEHLVELKKSYRFTDRKGIGRFSKAVINNNAAEIEQFLMPGADEQVIIDPLYAVELFESFVAGYAGFIKDKDTRSALKKMNALRVLCAIREGGQGLYAANKTIEKYLHDKKLLRVNAFFYENRPIILTRNYYEHGLFNGDTGIIRPDEKGTLMAWFESNDGELKAVLPGYLTEAETAFAMTIHKSQGSEFDEVLVILPESPDVPILTRELLYTAVTRAKRKVYVQAPAAVVLEASKRFVERASGIGGRFIAHADGLKN